MKPCRTILPLLSVEEHFFLLETGEKVNSFISTLRSVINFQLMLLFFIGMRVRRPKTQPGSKDRKYRQLIPKYPKADTVAHKDLLSSPIAIIRQSSNQNTVNTSWWTVSLWLKLHQMWIQPLPRPH